MSSSYSPDLRIELIGTGDQAGVWGNTTNNNLGTFIENAVAGYTSVSIVASPQALTANDGAADEARFAAIALTTLTGANFTVCIPPNSKLYTFYNASAYVATISNSTVKNGIVLSGGTTVAIPAGKTMSLWSDGTNVAQQNNNFIAPTFSGTTTTGAVNTTGNVSVTGNQSVTGTMGVGGIITGTLGVDATTNVSGGFALRARRSASGNAIVQLTDNTAVTQLATIEHDGSVLTIDNDQSGGVAITDNVTVTGLVISSEGVQGQTNAGGWGLRTIQRAGGNANIQFVSSSGTTELGYLQHDGTNFTLQSSVGGSVAINNTTNITGTLNVAGAANFTGSVDSVGRLICFAPGSGSTGGVQIKGAANGTTTSYVQFTNNAGNSQWGSVWANSSGQVGFQTYSATPYFDANGYLNAPGVIGQYSGYSGNVGATWWDATYADWSGDIPGSYFGQAGTWRILNKDNVNALMYFMVRIA